MFLGSFGDVNPYLHYDAVYAYSPSDDLKYDELENVLLAFDIPCSPKAYTDSWKLQTPSQCMAILSQEVYGISDLAQRCVRKQKNTSHLKKLDPMKTVALEREVYRFMRTKNFKIEDIEIFLLK